MGGGGKLYADRRSALGPYHDWHKDWAAGYRPNGNGLGGSTPWMNQRYVDAGYVMDPARPRGLVYANSKHGPVLIGAMCQLEGISQVAPDPGGPITRARQHSTVCAKPIGFDYAALTTFETWPLG